MTDRVRLTAAQFDALARAARKPLYRIASGRWSPVGSTLRIQAATVDRLLALGLLVRGRSRAATPLAEITEAGRLRLGQPSAPPPAPSTLHERIAP